MARITGVGCQLGALITAYACLQKVSPFDAALAATLHMGISGEIAEQHLKENEGLATYRIRLLDALELLGEAEWKRRATYECKKTNV